MLFTAKSKNYSQFNLFSSFICLTFFSPTDQKSLCVIFVLDSEHLDESEILAVKSRYLFPLSLSLSLYFQEHINIQSAYYVHRSTALYITGKADNNLELHTEYIRAFMIRHSYVTFDFTQARRPLFKRP